MTTNIAISLALILASLLGCGEGVNAATISQFSPLATPSMGLITLAMVLRQVGLPVEGIGMIVEVDRLLDRMHTVVNITGNSVVVVTITKFENSLDLDLTEGSKT